MPQRRLQSKHRQPLVSLGTIPNMSAVARKLSIARKAIEEINKIEDDLLKKGKEDMRVFKQKMDWTAKVSRSAGKVVGEAIDLLRTMRTDVEKYLRDEKNATD
jgi:uncharacterized protein YigA (DUF484 family)